MSKAATYTNALQELGDMIATFNFVENATTDASASKSTKAENKNRQATCEIRYKSRGVGQIRVAAPVVFPVMFSTEPHFTSGCALIKNSAPKLWHDPIGTAGVYAWKRDASGFYIGAYIWTRVDMYEINPSTTSDSSGAPALGTPPDDTQTQHYLTFTGRGVKAANYANYLSALKKARTVGIK